MKPYRWSIDTCYRTNKQRFCPSKISQTQKTTYYMIPIIRNVQIREIYRDITEISDCLGLEKAGEDKRMIIKGYGISV